MFLQKKDMNTYCFFIQLWTCRRITKKYKSIDYPDFFISWNKNLYFLIPCLRHIHWTWKVMYICNISSFNNSRHQITFHKHEQAACLGLCFLPIPPVNVTATRQTNYITRWSKWDCVRCNLCKFMQVSNSHIVR